MKKSPALFFGIISMTGYTQDSPRKKWLIKRDLVSCFPSFKFNTGKLNVEPQRPLLNGTSLYPLIHYCLKMGIAL